MKSLRHLSEIPLWKPRATVAIAGVGKMVCHLECCTSYLLGMDMLKFSHEFLKEYLNLSDVY
jgi:hypothetical protein